MDNIDEDHIENVCQDMQNFLIDVLGNPEDLQVYLRAVGHLNYIGECIDAMANQALDG